MNKKMMKTVKVSDLKTAPWNPRNKFDEKVVTEIAEDLKAGKPLIQAPSVWKCSEGGYYIIAGNTRMEAVRRAGLEEVEVVVWACSKDEAMAMTFKENEQRSDVYPVQQAKLIGDIFARGKDVEQIVAETRLKKSSVYDYLSISRRVHPDILKVALDHPSLFTKSDLLELTDYPMESQEPYAKEWAEELDDADDEEDNWRPGIWNLRNSSRSLKGCKFAGKGSKCSTCPCNSSNLSSLPGFEDEDDGERRCTNSKCYEETLNAWKKSVEDKKLSKYAERFCVVYAWNVSQYGAVSDRPTDEYPCCYYWWDGDKLRMLFGPSMAAKKEAEKAEKAAAKEKKAKDALDRENVDKAMVAVRDAYCVKEGYGEESVASLKGLFCEYFSRIEGEDGDGHEFLMGIGSSIMHMFNYHPDPEVVLDIVKTLGIDLPSEVMESVKRLANQD